MTLQQLMEHFFELYGRRNRIFLPSLGKRRLYLNLAASDLQQAIRQNVAPTVLESALARVAARIFCVVEHFKALPLVECLGRKYPFTHCTYCLQMPCICSERRPHPQILNLSLSNQRQWSLNEWSKHLENLYGPRNREKGIENLINRLFRELAELASAQARLPPAGATLDTIEESIAFELADVLAWTIAVANYLGCDLERALLNRYGQGCWECRQNPCQCTKFSFELMEW